MSVPISHNFGCPSMTPVKVNSPSSPPHIAACYSHRRARRLPSGGRSHIMTCYRLRGNKGQATVRASSWEAKAAVLDVTLLHIVCRKRPSRPVGGFPETGASPGSSHRGPTASNPFFLAELLPRLSMWGSRSPSDIDRVPVAFGILGTGLGVPRRDPERRSASSVPSSGPMPSLEPACVFARYYSAAHGEERGLTSDQPLVAVFLQQD